MSLQNKDPFISTFKLQKVGLCYTSYIHSMQLIPLLEFTMYFSMLKYVKYLTSFYTSDIFNILLLLRMKLDRLHFLWSICL